MSRITTVSPYGDMNESYSKDELIQMYLLEGKSMKEAEELADEVAKFMHADDMKQMRSWYKSHWERLDKV